MPKKPAIVLTDWFPPTILPVREGLYEVRMADKPDETWYAYWTPALKRWGWAYPNKSWASQKRWRTEPGSGQSKPWRGIAGSLEAKAVRAPAAPELKLSAKATEPSTSQAAQHPAALDIMGATSYGAAALKMMGKVPENFRIYRAGWLEEKSEDWNTMEVSGAEFRAPIRGPRKGELCVLVPGTKRTVYVTKAQMKAADKQKAASNKKAKA